MATIRIQRIEGRVVTEGRTDEDAIASPTVTVVIPCYNQANYLREAIESVLNQTYPEIEVIVVDDGSTDHTEVVARSFPLVQYVYQANQGLAAARNAGLHVSRGKFLLFLDADDRLVEDAIEVGVTSLSEHPDAGFVSGHYRYIHADGTFLHEHPQPAIAGDAYGALLSGNYIGMHATVLYRRTALEAVGGFTTTLRACEDYDIYLKLTQRFAVHRHNKVMAEYRQHPKNMSHNAELMLKSAISVLEAQWPYARQTSTYRNAYHVGKRFWKQYYGEKLTNQALELWRQGERIEAVTVAARLLLLAPSYTADKGARWVRLRVAAAKKHLPFGARKWLAARRGELLTAPIGEVNFGDLRRLVPFSRHFGYERGLPVDRYYIENFLERHARDVRGRVLEVGDDTYTVRFGGARVTRRDVLHVSGDNPAATLVGDLATAPHLPSGTFECIILTQTLHLIYDLQAAIQTLHRLLKPGGVLLLTVPGISQISHDEWAKTWYWSFTPLSLHKLLANTFGTDSVECSSNGNVLAAIAFLQGLAVADLLEEELAHNDPLYPCVIAARAVKADANVIKGATERWPQRRPTRA